MSFNLTFFILGVISVVINLISVNTIIVKMINSILIFSIAYFLNADLILFLPILLTLPFYFTDEQFPIEALKLILFTTCLFNEYAAIEISIALLFLMWVLSVWLKIKDSKENILIVANSTYTLSFVSLAMLATFSLVTFHDKSELFDGFIKPIAALLWITTILRSLDIIGSRRVLNIKNKVTNPSRKITNFLLNKYYIPILTILTLKKYILPIDTEMMQLISIFIASFFIVAFLKIIFEIVIQNNPPNKAMLIFNFYIGVFLCSGLFFEKELFSSICYLIIYFQLIYSVLFSGFFKKINPLLKSLGIMFILPTPFSPTFYEGLKVYNQLILMNFTLMSTTLILILLLAFLIRINVFENMLVKNEKIQS